ncbi:NAD(P)(+) transhydrogenase (Re/Si-specific) subunit beta [Candidatus Woesearchaeota archaeon]|nr:NAD(P)(+) transhydrogenase (Re/Si-specific) subunit beta [Candidatus Woesearchaeota archaeon]
MELMAGIVYLVAAILFIIGIKQLSKIKTAANGNIISAIAMLIAIIITAIKLNIDNPAVIQWPFIIAGIIIGTIIGYFLAVKIKMTAMPQLVAIFNGFGGGASVFVALAYFLFKGDALLSNVDMITVVLSCLIGIITFSGSMVAFAKLQGLIDGQPIMFPGSHILNLMLAIGTIALGYLAVVQQATFSNAVLFLLLLTGIAFVLGILLVTPIGGADMPVVIALLNAYSGIAAAMTGFVLGNILLIIAGSLVGASGIILTRIMCKAMNRSLANVLFGGFGQHESNVSKDKSEYQNIKSTSPEEVAAILDAAQNVIIVPGYGMAVSQAQNAVRDVFHTLEKKGANVEFAIHPVAGRMPGHMNVLLAEADIPYDKMKDLDSINDSFKQTDVVIILGANDVVNPSATEDKSSPIYGMPILNVHEAKTVIVVKRSLSPGFAGIKNPLFEKENTLMMFADAKEAMAKLNTELKEL